jgi:hypothetical protein
VTVRSSQFASALLAFILTLTWCSPAAGQWVLGVEVGAYRFWGGSVETTPDGRSFHPYRPTVFGLALERRITRLGVGLRLHYMDAALGLEGQGAAVAIGGAFDVSSLTPEISYLLATPGGENELRLHAGPLLELWETIDEETKIHVGMQANISFRVPLGGRFAGSLLVGAAVSPSPFTGEQLEQNFEPRTLWRRGVVGRLEYRL